MPATRPTITLTALALLLVACGGSRMPHGGQVLNRSPELMMVRESGLQVAPAAHVDPVADAAEISAFMTNALYAQLLANTDRVELRSPQDLLDHLALQGEEGLSLFREFRRARVRDDAIDPAAARELSRLILHRYVLLSWVDEEEEMGMDERVGDYTEAYYAEEVRRTAFTVVKGRLHGEVVDLWEARSLWRAVSTYESGRIYTRDAEERRDLELARASGALRLVSMLAAF